MVTTILAAPGAGSTSLSILEALTFNHNKNICHMTFDLSEEKVINKYRNYFKNNLSSPIGKINVKQFNPGLFSLDGLKEFVKQKSEEGFNLFVIDNISLVNMGGDLNRYESISKAFFELKVLAKKHDVDFIVVQYANRNFVDERFSLQDLEFDLENNENIIAVKSQYNEGENKVVRQYRNFKEDKISFFNINSLLDGRS